MKTEKLTDSLSPQQYQSLTEVWEYIAATHSDLPAYTCLGKTLTYAEIDRLSSCFAAYLQQHTCLQPGDHIALQLPNVLQFPVAFFGALKAGLVVVNTNPLYTAHEMQHQFIDAEVKAIIILENFCDKLQAVLPKTQIETVIVTRLGDLQAPVKRLLVNTVIKYVKGMVPKYDLPQAIDFTRALASSGEAKPVIPPRAGDDIALLLYTGGTTGVSKGAMLTHKNLIANMMQLRSRCMAIIDDRVETIAAPLPLYHSYAFLLHCLAMPYAGNHNLLITNPRDLDAMFKDLSQYNISGFVGINTLFLAMLRHPKMDTVDWAQLKFCGAGGMALTPAIATEWQERTGCEIFEGYGLTECSPVVSVNQPGRVKLGTVGELVPETEARVVDEEGNELALGEKGELWIRGPQVMLGYWKQKAATEEAITPDGWFKTGDYACIDDEGYISIVDRKKDMILVSGFNVFPNEVEDWVVGHPGVLECAAIGKPDERLGEAIQLYVVKRDPKLTEADVIEHCRSGLTAYKVPREVIFMTELPKSNVGKILRRELREATG